MKRGMTSAVGLLVMATVLAGCGGDDDDDAGGAGLAGLRAPTSTASPVPTATPTRPAERRREPTSTPTTAAVQPTPTSTPTSPGVASTPTPAGTPRATATSGARSTPTPTATPATRTSTRWLTGYYASYTEFPPASMPPTAVDYTALTHVIHWPVAPRGAGTFDPNEFGLTEAQSSALVTAAHAAGTKALLGFGGDVATVGTGWQTSTSPANRPGFIQRMVALMTARGYDGIDINWEGLSPADGAQFTAFITELRAALNNITPRPLLTMAPTTGFDAPVALVAGVRQSLDQINVQTYVLSGAYPGWVTWFNSPLFNGNFTFPSTGTEVPSADDEIDRYIAGGIPASKLALGMQFDAFVWTGGSGTDTGGASKPRQTWTYGNPKPDGSDVGAPTVTLARMADAITNFTTAAGYTKVFDTVAKVPYLSRDQAGSANDRFVSIEDDQSIQEKAAYLAAKGLGGAFIFEVSGDYLPGAPAGDARHPLLTSAREHIREGFVDTAP